MEKLYINASEVSELLGVSVSKAYSLIKGLNQEMSKQGYLVVNGKVNKRYFMEKCYNSGVISA